MAPDERLGLARLAYLQAIVSARARSSSSTWRRLLRAANNVRAAIRERERARLGPRAGTPKALPAAGSRERERPHGGGAVGSAASSPHILDLARASRRGAERERARSLLERSRRLVRESRAVLLRARRAAPALFPILAS